MKNHVNITPPNRVYAENKKKQKKQKKIIILRLTLLYSLATANLTLRIGYKRLGGETQTESNIIEVWTRKVSTSEN